MEVQHIFIILKSIQKDFSFQLYAKAVADSKLGVSIKHLPLQQLPYLQTIIFITWKELDHPVPNGT